MYGCHKALSSHLYALMSLVDTVSDVRWLSRVFASAPLKTWALLFKTQGWSGGAMVLGKLTVPGRPTYLE